MDTVPFFKPTENEGLGYCFDRYEPLDLYTCMIRAYEGFRFKDAWQKLQVRAMSQDFSWYRSSEDYIKMYREVIGEAPELTAKEQKIIAQKVK